VKQHADLPDDSVFAERMFMPGCAYPCMMIMINQFWPLEPYPILALAPNADIGFRLMVNSLWLSRAEWPRLAALTVK
jgi:hypothetical protein